MEVGELFTLKGKTALVTGAAQGLGREIALALAKNGAELILSDIQYPEATAGEVQETGRRWITVQADITDEDQVKTLAERAASEFGRVDILINNAGVSQLSYTATEDLSKAEWDNIIGINLTGTFLCCKHVGKEMIKGGGGSIINIATTAGITGVPRAPAYSASKAGVILLTKSLALEWARHHIRVNAIAPHYLETPLTEGLRASGKVYAGLVKQIPMRRFGKPSEMIGAVLFLSSQASTYTTGTVIVADGGYLAQ
ncbi:MAG: SDR family NAD(P)-dependent oxidoreductase [Desulfobacteraceae bacterium]|jgi:NAD(P)-dependent dehydrogenase (short-subunit alcohol dehydrogenase family)